MPLFTLGINHTTAPVRLRERLAISAERIKPALHGLVGLANVQEAAILSTCNRTEWYCNLETPSNDLQIMNWLSEFHNCNSQDIQPHLYRYCDQEAVKHTLRVACGLDSMVLGEPQILGQLKSAYQDANHAGTLGRHLSRLFQHAFSAAKQIRTETDIGANPVSVAFAAVNLAKQIYGNLNTCTVLLVGAGETMELAARHLSRAGIKRMLIANRSLEKAENLARKFSAQAISLTEISQVLHQADIVITSTASPLPILGKGLVESALKQRKHRPIFMLDIAVPRDIEEEVAELRDVYLYTIDDLHAVIQDNLQSRRDAAVQADVLIDVRVEQFMRWLRAQDAVGTIRAYRDRADRYRRDSLERTRRMIEQGKPADEAIEYLAHTLTNRLIHDATNAMNQAGQEGREELLNAARELLKLDDENTHE